MCDQRIREQEHTNPFVERPFRSSTVVNKIGMFDVLGDWDPLVNCVLLAARGLQLHDYLTREWNPRETSGSEESEIGVGAHTQLRAQKRKRTCEENIVQSLHQVCSVSYRPNPTESLPDQVKHQSACRAARTAPLRPDNEQV